jgi:hypothetical protein
MASYIPARRAMTVDPVEVLSPEAAADEYPNWFA